MFERDYDHPNGPGRTRACSCSFLTCGALAAVNIDERETLALSVYVALSPSPRSLCTQNFTISRSLSRRSPPDLHENKTARGSRLHGIGRQKPIP